MDTRWNKLDSRWSKFVFFTGWKSRAFFSPGEITSSVFSPGEKAARFFHPVKKPRRRYEVFSPGKKAARFFHPKSREHDPLSQTTAPPRTSPRGSLSHWLLMKISPPLTLTLTAINWSQAHKIRNSTGILKQTSNSEILTVFKMNSREISKPRGWCLELSDRAEIWLAFPRHSRGTAGQIPSLIWQL